MGMSEISNKEEKITREDELYQYIKELVLNMAHYLGNDVVSSKIDRLYRQFYGSEVDFETKELSIAKNYAHFDNYKDRLLDDMIMSDDGKSRGICRLDDDNQEVLFKGLNQCIKNRVNASIDFSLDMKNSSNINDDEDDVVVTLPTISDRAVFDISEDIVGKSSLFLYFFLGNSKVFESKMMAFMDEEEIEELSKIIDDSVYNGIEDKRYDEIIKTVRTRKQANDFYNIDYEEMRPKLR